MSFRQDRTNPSTAVSNWRGRSETPKAWPSTRTSTWMNGGLFGGAVSFGPALEYVSTFTVASTTSEILVITGVPTTYRDVLIVGQNMRLAAYGNAPWMNPTDPVGSYSSASSGLAAASSQDNNQVNQATSSAASGGAAISYGQMGTMDIPSSTQLYGWGTYWWSDSSSTTRPKTVAAVTDGTGYISSSDGGRAATVFSAYNTTAAMTDVRWDAKGASGGAVANYYWVAGTQFHIYGIGTKI